MNIVIIQGHPDAGGGHLCHALADAYAAGAEDAGHSVRRIDVAKLDFPVLRAREEWTDAAPPPDIAAAQETVRWAGHLVFVYPLWLGTMPALVKAFFEQIARPGFALDVKDGGRGFRKLLSGRSARVVVTMGMPAFVYRWWFGAHSLKSLERNILRFVGISPIRESLFGMVETASEARRRRWLDKMRDHGARGR